MQQPSAIFLMGPTASGKTGLAVELAARLPVEIVSVDSALVYRGMDIGTAKPDAETLRRAPHHLIDLIAPTESYSAAQFRADALACMDGIVRRGRIPLLVGGTMLYFNALQHGLNALPEADPELRADLLRQAREQGWPALHSRLAVLDPETAARLKPNDAQRIERALEICLVSGRPMSELLREQKSAPLPYRLLKLALVPSERAVLHERIARRYDLMLDQGLVEEVRVLRSRYPDLHAGLPSMRCVGYRQAWQHLDGEIGLDEMRDKGIVATRQLAKRQLTWLRSMTDTSDMDCLKPDMLDSALQIIGQFNPQ